jgi:hypothetical protein
VSDMAAASFVRFASKIRLSNRDFKPLGRNFQ